jgi:outer membrane autotransporter protein
LYGGSVGADFEFGESIILGGAYSNVSSDFKYDGTNKNGNKTDVKSHVFSIYAQTSLTSDIAWHNIVSLSKSDLEGKRNAEGNSVASSKSKSEGLSFETNLGYKLVQDDIMLVPNIGLRYGYFKDKGYTETGAGVHNITQSASSSKILTGTLGAKVMWNTKVGDASFSPYLQGSIDHNFSHQGGKVNAKFVWMENYFASKAETGNKPEKTAYNIGAGALMKQGNVELSLGYNLNLAKKYQAHQGTVKLKLSF